MKSPAVVFDLDTPVPAGNCGSSPRWLTVGNRSSACVRLLYQGSPGGFFRNLLLPLRVILATGIGIVGGGTSGDAL